MSHPPSSRPPTSKIRKVLIFLGVITFLLVTTCAAAYWWHNRPITPIVLNASEQQKLDQKMEVTQKRSYQPGEKIITLSEREVNALFHSNTGLGDRVKFELADDAIHARIRTELDEDLPVIGGHTLKAKARFILKDQEQHPAIILDDFTVWGISLPNAWLGDFKGKNLISDLGFNNPTNDIARGIKEIKVNHGEITIELAE